VSHLRIIEPAEASGALAELSDRMKGRPMPPVHRQTHGGVSAVATASSCTLFSHRRQACLAS
jgi:hypothetical protein